jgi:hypothetical protein
MITVPILFTIQTDQGCIQEDLGERIISQGLFQKSSLGEKGKSPV